MNTFLYLLVGSLFLIGTVVTLFALSHAVPGYEDECGFHLGRPPTRRFPRRFVTQIRVLRSETNQKGEPVQQEGVKAGARRK